MKTGFPPGYFTRDKIPQGVQVSATRNKFRTGTHSRVLNYSTEHLNLPSNCKYLPVSLLKVK